MRMLRHPYACLRHLRQIRNRFRQRSRAQSPALALGYARLTQQELEPRLVLSATSFAGNECQPDLDLSGIPAQTIVVGDTWTFDLLAEGATATDVNADGSATGDTFHFQLDPDVGVDVPDGVVLIDVDGNEVLTNDTGLLRWTPTSDQVGEHTIMILMMDAGQPVLADAEQLTVTVTTEINTPAIVDLNGAASGNGFSTPFVAGSGSTSIVGTVAPNALTITDAQNSDIQSATAALINPLDGAAESLAVDTGNTGLTSSYDDSSGTLEITGTASIAVYQDVLRTLAYDNASTSPILGQRSVQITVNDGSVSDPVTSTIDVQAAVEPNESPSMAAIADQTVVIGNSIAVSVTATDPNVGDMLTFELDPDDRPDTASIESSGSNSAVVRWTPAADDGPGPHTIRVTVTDDGTPEMSDAQDFLVSVQFPTEIDLNGPGDGTGFATTFNPGIGPVAMVDAAALTVDDPDSATIVSITASLQNRPDGTSEVLAVDETLVSSITSSYASGVLTLTGNNSSAADFQQVLRTLTYNNTAASPTIGDRVIEVLPDDGATSSMAAISTVSVVAGNNAPTITPINNQTATVGEPLTIDVFADDPDGDVLEFALDVSPGAINKTSATTARIEWTPSAVGTFDFRVVVTDDGIPVESDSEEFTVTVSAPGPSLDLNGGAPGIDATASFSEDTGPTAILNEATTITAGGDLVSATVLITNLLDGDAEELDITTVNPNIGVQYNDGLLALVGTASASTYEAVLESLTYNNSSDDPTTTPRVLELQVSDGSNFSPLATTTVDIAAVNDAPIIDPIDDVQAEATTPFMVTVSAVDPEGDDVSFALDAPPNGVVISDDENGSATISWTPPIEGSFAITVIASDEADPPATSSQMFTVNVVAFNAAPIVDLNGVDEGFNKMAGFVEDSAPILLAADVVLDDDGTEITSATAELTSAPDGGQELLDVTIPDFSSVTPSYDGGVLTLTGPDTLANYELILASITYVNNSQAPDPMDRQVEITVSDGAKNSNVATVTIDVTAVNDAPVIDPIPDRFAEIDVPLAFEITASDVDNEIIAIRAAQITTDAGATVTQNDETPRATFSWTPDTLGVFTLGVEVEDVQLDGTTPIITTGEFTITVHPPNTIPVVDLNGELADGIDTMAAFVEDGGAVVLAPDVRVIDGEDPDIQAATIAITNPLDGDEEVLSAMTAGTGVTPEYTDGVLTLSGTATKATYEAILASLTYNNVSQNPTATERVIEVTIDDGIDESEAAIVTVSVAAVNDPPVADEIDDQQAVIDEELTVLLEVTDPDSSALSFELDDPSAPGAEIREIDGERFFVWTPTSDVTPGTYEVTILVTDDADPAGSELLEFEVDVLVRPFVDLNTAAAGTGFTSAWNFGGAAVPIASSRLEVFDPDSPTLDSAAVAIVDPVDGRNEVLVWDDLDTNINVVYDPDINVLSMTGFDTPENYRRVLSTVQYANTADAPSYGTRTIQLAVNDGDLLSNIPEGTIIVQFIPDGSDTIDSAEMLDLDVGQTLNVPKLIEHGGDVDMYEVQANNRQTIFASIRTSTLNVVIRVFDDSGVEVASGEMQTTYDVTEDGTYYIGISADDLPDYDPNDVLGRMGDLIGSYDLTVSRFQTGLDNNTIPLATTLTLSGDMPTVVEDELVSTSDVDLFAVDVTAGAILQVEVTESDDDVVIRIFDELGNDIGIDDGTPDFLSAGPLTDGTVYIGISSDGLGDYHPNNPAGRSGGTPTDYELEITLGDEPAAAAVDAVMQRIGLLRHDTYVPPSDPIAKVRLNLA